MNNNNSYYKYYKSPEIPYSKYECSPIISIEKYHFFKGKHCSAEKEKVIEENKNIVKVEMSSEKESNFKNEMESFKDKSTPKFKAELENTGEVVKPIFKMKNVTMGNFMENVTKLNDGAHYLPLPNIISSLKRTESTNFSQIVPKIKVVYTNPFKNIQNTEFTLNSDYIKTNIPITQNFFLKNNIPTKFNNNFSFINRKKRRTDVEDYISRTFKLNEIIVNGKYIIFLPEHPFDSNHSNFISDTFENSSSSRKRTTSYSKNSQTNSRKYDSPQTDSETTIKIIRPIFEKNFKKLNSFKEMNIGIDSSLHYSDFSKMSLAEFSKISKSTPRELNFLKLNLNSNKFKYTFKKELIKFENDINLNEIPYKIKNDPKKLYDDLLDRLKISLTNLQRDYVSKAKKAINPYHLSEVEKLIDDLNRLYEIFLSTLRIIQQKKKKIIYYYESYNCEICQKEFETGQGLGGHMSRMHPNQSEKYKLKMQIRNNRTELREVIYNAKKQIISKDGFDYDKLKKIGDKKTITKIIKSNFSEYKEILKNLKKERGENEKNANVLREKISKNFFKKFRKSKKSRKINKNYENSKLSK